MLHAIIIWELFCKNVTLYIHNNSKEYMLYWKIQKMENVHNEDI